MFIMAIRCLVLLLIMTGAFSQSLDLKKFLSSYRGSSFKVAARLSKPLLTDDGRIYACSGKNILLFDSNGTVVWIIPLGYSSSADISPIIDDRGKIYLIAEDRILKITPSNIGTSKPTSEVFFGPNSTIGGSGEIIGFSLSILYACIFVTVKNRGLFALSFRGELLWSAGPVLYQFGYRHGCKENSRDCYFSSAPVVDQCEGTLYIFNTEGQLYSIYMRSHHYRWVQDFSSIDKFMTVIPGNNGLLYVIFPRKASAIALDVYTGDISWQWSFGPLSTEQSLPVVDSNGWLSIGSLDGYLYSFSPTGEVKKLLKATAIGSVIQASPVLDCSGFAIYVLQTKVTAKSNHDIGNYTYISAMNPTGLVLTNLIPATGTVYWTGNYRELTNLLSSSDLRYFTVDERIFLAFLSSSRTGKSLPCHTMNQKIAWMCAQSKPKFDKIYIGNEEAILPFIFFQLAVLVLLAFSVRFCFIFWRKKKLQDHGLVRFLDKRRSLHHKRRTLGRMISKIEQRAVEDIDVHQTLEQLGEMVKAKEGIERKLSSSYSLGRDNVISRQGSILPLCDGKEKSHSFHSTTKESVTMFNTLSSTESGSDSDDSSGRGSRLSWRETEQEEKGKAVVVASSSSTSNLDSENESGEGSASSTSSTRFSMNPMISKHWIDGWGSEGLARRKLWLKKTLSSTN
ncbi:protein GAMETE EXPRESSED 3 isoform X2 [Phalaenopsis equestris]|uniref:protein GAMETE EXPRESSED 3 isoform X2 n=1 Tax=Phalaenopsis equestris TaxID=78828 RepID=UPI0009E59333|nr:protein GAMETE EXPRESSED 3 isoform X2 [Phalaenopsis equestris]